MPARSGHNAIRALEFGCLVLLLLAAWLPLRPAPALFGYPINEDGYYALTVARHLGLGHGLTVDGIHATGGVQPLWVFLLAPISWLCGGDRTALVRGALAISTILYAMAAILIAAFTARLARAADLPVHLSASTAALLYLACGTCVESHFNLLETGLVLALYLIVLWMAARIDWRKPHAPLALGALCGILVLARVDTVFFVMLLTPLMVRPPEAGGKRPWLARIVIVPAIAALVASPWFAYNASTFGHLTPSGGLAQGADRFAPGRLLVAAMYLAGRLVPLPFDIVWPSRYENWAAAALAFGLLVLLFRPSLRARVMAVVSTRDGRALTLLVVNGVALVIWYGVTSRAWWMFMRYVAPAVLAGAPALALMFAARLRQRTFVSVLLSASAVATLAAARYLPATAGIRERSHLFFVTVAADVVPADARLGAFQSGTLGYFRDNVVNLDGKVNEAALAARDRTKAYCDAEGIAWVADWPAVLERDFFHGPPTAEWAFVAERRVAGCNSCDFQVFRRK